MSYFDTFDDNNSSDITQDDVYNNGNANDVEATLIDYPDVNNNGEIPDITPISDNCFDETDVNIDDSEPLPYEDIGDVLIDAGENDNSIVE